MRLVLTTAGDGIGLKRDLTEYAALDPGLRLLLERSCVVRNPSLFFVSYTDLALHSQLGDKLVWALPRHSNKTLYAWLNMASPALICMSER
jgi:hypothetical protein